ncbi:putative inactive beta-glucuronidase protein GUSBP11 isoform X2 [Callithrix jacchus]
MEVQGAGQPLELPRRLLRRPAPGLPGAVVAAAAAFGPTLDMQVLSSFKNICQDSRLWHFCQLGVAQMGCDLARVVDPGPAEKSGAEDWQCPLLCHSGIICYMTDTCKWLPSCLHHTPHLPTPPHSLPARDRFAFTEWTGLDLGRPQTCELRLNNPQQGSSKPQFSHPGYPKGYFVHNTDFDFSSAGLQRSVLLFTTLPALMTSPSPSPPAWSKTVARASTLLPPAIGD